MTVVHRRKNKSCCGNPGGRRRGRSGDRAFRRLERQQRLLEEREVGLKTSLVSVILACEGRDCGDVYVGSQSSTKQTSSSPAAAMHTCSAGCCCFFFSFSWSHGYPALRFCWLIERTIGMATTSLLPESPPICCRCNKAQRKGGAPLLAGGASRHYRS